MSMDFIRGFKDKYFLVKSVLHEVFDSLLEEVIVVDEDGNMFYDENGNVETKLVSKFSFHWCASHFDHGPRYYLTPASCMDDEDEESYGNRLHWWLFF